VQIIVLVLGKPDDKYRAVISRRSAL
jgi:hypothetical protein